MPDLAPLEALLRAPHPPAAAEAKRLWQTLPSAEQEAAAALALALGCPRLALAWSASPWIQAPARLRLGEAQGARAALADLPDSARRAVLWARAGAQRGEVGALTLAQAARSQARREGDAAALVAAATLLAELEAPDLPRQALRTLAEGLKVAELTGTEADAHLLAVLAHVQARVGSPARAGQTAARALDRSAPRSPARVLALLALGEPGEAEREAEAGEVAPVWWAPYREG